MEKSILPSIISTGLSKDYKVILTTDGKTEQERLVALAGEIFGVDSSDEYTTAGETVAQLRKFGNGIEKARKEIKAPLLKAGKLVDAAADEATRDTASEVARIEGLMGTFQQKQIQIAMAQRETERKQLEQKQREIEELERKAQELRAQSQKADDEFLPVAGEVAKQAEQAQALVEQARAQVVPQVAVSLPVAAGASARNAFEYEVTDIPALYRFNATLVNLEPAKAAIRAYIEAVGTDAQIPGLKITSAVKVTVRAGR